MVLAYDVEEKTGFVEHKKKSHPKKLKKDIQEYMIKERWEENLCNLNAKKHSNDVWEHAVKKINK